MDKKELAKQLMELTVGIEGQSLEIIVSLISSIALVFVIFSLFFFLVLGIIIFHLAKGLPGVSTISSKSSATTARSSYRGIDEALGRVVCYHTPRGTKCDCSAIESQLVTIDFMGRRVRVHRKAKSAFEAVVRDIKAAGIKYN
ncbi:hypothetical protein J7L13_00675, partial [bacterium]|nr:hypothetical protein [bacterium]